MTHYAPTPAIPVKSARIVAGLATLYYRYNDPARALALGLMALRCGADAPSAVLLVASCFLNTGDAEQAEAALSRLAPGDLAPQEAAAYKFLLAKVRFRTGDQDAAQQLLAEAHALATQEARS